MRRICGFAFLVAVGVCVGAGGALAGTLSYTGQYIDVTGTGQGNVDTILKLQDSGTGQSDGYEFGEVRWSGTADLLGSGLAGDDTAGGASASQTYSVADVFGATGNTDLGIVFNISETGTGSDLDVTIDNLSVLLFKADGTSLGTIDWTGSETLAEQGGAGQSGWLWRASNLGTFLDDPTNRFGLRVAHVVSPTGGVIKAGITNFDDGPEQFFVTSLAAAPVPAAFWVGLLCLTLALAGRAIRRRRLA